MKTGNYLVLCTAATLAWVAALLAMPGFARTVEQLLLMFLSTNA